MVFEFLDSLSEARPILLFTLQMFCLGLSFIENHFLDTQIACGLGGGTVSGLVAGSDAQGRNSNAQTTSFGGRRIYCWRRV